MENNDARDMKEIKSLKKVASGKQEWNTKLYREGKSKQLAAITKTQFRNFQGKMVTSLKGQPPKVLAETTE